MWQGSIACGSCLAALPQFILFIGVCLPSFVCALYLGPGVVSSLSGGV